jgi:hypothetical protein
MAFSSGRALVVRPVARATAPRYPTFESFAAQPTWLLRYIPPRWHRCRIALGALTAFALGRVAAAGDIPVVAGEAPAPLAPQPAKPSASSERLPLVAPIFVHGEGRGSTGCVAIAPPVFLSEAEALEILWSELGGAGLGFERRAHAARLGSQKSAARPIAFDLWSPPLGLGVAFVGAHNYEVIAGRAANAVEGQDGEIGFSTVDSYDTLGVAQQLADRLRETHADSAAVLYDPLVHRPYRRPDTNEPRDLRARARDQLRAQVRDFVDWARTRLIAPGDVPSEEPR